VKGCQSGEAFQDGVASITISPDGRNLYAATYAGVAVFDRDPESGALSQKPGAEGCISSTPKLTPTCAAARGLPGASDVAVSSEGMNVYAATPRALVVFDRDPSTGALTQKPSLEGMVLSGAGEDVLVNPDGRNVYVNSRGLITFDRDPETGALTSVPGPAGCVSEKGEGGCRRGHEFSVYYLAISPDGHNVYAAGEVTQKVGVVDVLDRLPDGTLMQKPGRAGCIGGESGKKCADPGSQGEVRGISASPDGKRVYVFEYPFPGEGDPLLRHPSGRLTEVPRR